jgi:signal transduction histidine kinase
VSLDPVWIDAHLARLGNATACEHVLYVVIDREAGRARAAHDWTRSGESMEHAPDGVALDLLAGTLSSMSGRREVFSVLTPDTIYAQAGPFAERLRAWGWQALVTAPVLVAGALAGFVVVAWDTPAEPDRPLLDLVMMGAELLAARLENGIEAPDRVPAERVSPGAAGESPMRAARPGTPPLPSVELPSVELRHEQERMRALVDAIPDLMFELDNNGVFVNVHAPDRTVLAADPAVFVGREITDVLNTEIRDDILAAIDRLQDGSGPEVVVYTIPIDGVARRFECRLVRESSGGILAVVRDVTGPAERARVLREQSLKLTRANEELQRALQSRDEFLARVSHELRTPLNAILGHIEILVDDPTMSEKQQVSVATIDSSGRHLLALINDLLDLSRMNTTMSALDLRQASVNQICRLAVDFIRPRALQKGLRLEFIDDSDQALIQADANRMRKVLINLLDNAVKFTDPGGSLGLRVWPPDPDHIAFSVWDTGIGIHPEDQNRVFEPFTQIDGGMARRHQGSGLGLALVERLVALHGGWVEVDSERGRGSRFTAVVPSAGPPAEPDEAP